MFVPEANFKFSTLEKEIGPLCAGGCKKMVCINILENRRRVTKKNVAILADSLPLSASRHNTMFLKNWQHLLYVYFSCVSGTNKSKQHHNKIKREGDFESANQITAKNHNIGEREAPYKRSNNDLTNSC